MITGAATGSVRVRTIQELTDCLRKAMSAYLISRGWHSAPCLEGKSAIELVELAKLLAQIE
jgi:hypothetical protein